MEGPFHRKEHISRLNTIEPVQGVLAGTSALIGNTVFAFANASAKMLSSARQSLLVAGLDRPQPLPTPPGKHCRCAFLGVCRNAEPWIIIWLVSRVWCHIVVQQLMFDMGHCVPTKLPCCAATGEAMALERRLTVPPDVGQAGFMGALLNGVAGLLSEPIRCGPSCRC